MILIERDICIIHRDTGISSHSGNSNVSHRTLLWWTMDFQLFATHRFFNHTLTVCVSPSSCRHRGRDIAVHRSVQHLHLSVPVQGQLPHQRAQELPGVPWRQQLQAPDRDPGEEAISRDRGRLSEWLASGWGMVGGRRGWEGLKWGGFGAYNNHNTCLCFIIPLTFLIYFSVLFSFPQVCVILSLVLDVVLFL